MDDVAPLGPGTDIGLQNLGSWSALPILGTNRYAQFSSYNRKPGTTPLEPGGKDFNNFIALSGSAQPLFLGNVDGPDPDGGRLGGYVLASVDDGPGYVSRLFFTRFQVLDALRGASFLTSPDLGRFSRESLRIFVDDLDAPALVIGLADLGTSLPFAAPLAGPNAAAVVSYTPISFTQRLRVVLDGLDPLSGYFYHVDVQRTDQPTRAFSPRLAEDPAYAVAAALLSDFGANPNRGGEVRVDVQSFSLAPGVATTIFAHPQGGTLDLLRFAFDAIDQVQLGHIQLQVYWDGASAPAVDVPLDAFFDCHERIAPFRTLAMQVVQVDDGLEVASYLPMPFAQQARVDLRNDGDTVVALRASVNVSPLLPVQPWGYLHALFNAVSGPQPAGSSHEVVNVIGRGRYVGTALSAAGNSDLRPGQLAASLNILEGNELGVIDGEARIHGTGTEDYYNGAFYFVHGPFDHPFAAANVVKGGLGADPGIVSCCRWHVLSDAIDFQSSFELRFQYGADNPALVVRYATVAYFYLDRP